MARSLYRLHLRASGAGALAAGLCCLVAACSAAPPAEPASATPSLAPVAPSATPDALATRTQAEIAVPGGPDLPIDAFGSLWLLTPDSGEPSITRLDPASNEIVATIPIGGRLCQTLGATDDAIWACTNDGAVRVDPETNEISAEVEFPTAQVFGYLPFGAGSLWALGGEVTLSDQLVRIDPAANDVVETYELGFDASWISYGENALWLTDTAGGKLWRFDPESGALEEHATDLAEPGPSAVGAGSVWLALHAGRETEPSATDVTVVRLDPVSGATQAGIATGGSMLDGMVFASDEAVWARAPRPFLTRVDPRTNEIVESFDANRAGGSVTLAYGSVWATSFDFHKVWRLSP